MEREISHTSERAVLREKALSRWENEGGVVQHPEAAESPGGSGATPPLSNAEVVQLQVRVIALENLVIALLARAPDGQFELARRMADYISPRPGFTPHRLTLHAASQMKHLVDRASLFRDTDLS